MLLQSALSYTTDHNSCDTNVVKSELNRIHEPFDAHCCHMGTALKHVPDRIKPTMLIFGIRGL